MNGKYRGCSGASCQHFPGFISGEPMGTGCLLLALAESSEGWGCGPGGGEGGGRDSPPQPQSLLGSRMLGDPMTTDTGGAKRDSSMGHHHPCPDHHLILNCHTWGLFSPPPKGWPLGWACEHQRISHGRETEAGRGQYWLPNTHQSLGPHCLPPVSPPTQGIQKYICVMEG